MDETQMADDLERATAVQAEDGRYLACLSPDWEIWGPNGGYLAAIALRAAGAVAEIQSPASFYCHFLSSPAFEAVQLDVSVLKRGRRAESFAVEMTQDGKPILHALVRTAADAPGYSHQHSQAPEVPPPEALKNDEELRPARRRYAFWRNVERRPIEQGTSERPLAARRPAAPVLREWARYRPTACFADPFLDAARALILLDTYGYPAAYRHYGSSEYLAPNLDTSAWFHHRSPESEWLLVDHECVVADRGLMGVNGKVWDTAGRLLASGGAQLCCIPNQR
jgi:acyl-CoA thioesterase-2